MKKLCYLLLLLVLIAACSQETIDPNLTVYDIDSGWGLDKDSDGNLWTNNSYGIAKFDVLTNEWTQYSKSTEFDIRSNAEGPILIDGDDIWISYGWENDPDGLGVTKWDRSSNTFTHYAADLGTPNMPGGPVWEITKKEDGTIWIGTRFNYAAAYFDGTSWNSFYIEDGSTFFDCNTINFYGDYGYFESYRGGLHIYDFNSSSWIHSSDGVNSGTQSFFHRGFWRTCLLVNSNQDIYLASTNNLGDDFGAPPQADGIWHYNGTSWSNISPSDYTAGEITERLIKDKNGDIWAMFHQDKSIRIWNGSSWTDFVMEGIEVSDEYYFVPEYFDGEYMWLSLNNNGTYTFARYKI